MLDRYDSTELLALIEGELDPSAAAAVQQRLERDPQAAARVRAMIGDRSDLRSIDEPELPADFIAAIEPMLSRPMLIEHVAQPATLTGSEYRRMHRRRSRNRRAGRLAVAAAVLLMASGGIWAVVANMDHLRGAIASDSRMALNDKGSAGEGRAASSSAAVAPRASVDSHTQLGPGAIHHDLRPHAIAHNDSTLTKQPTASSDRVAAVGRGGHGERGERGGPAAPVIVPADFAIVIDAVGSSAAEDRLKSLLVESSSASAIVRNFSYAEAQRLANEHRLAHGETARGSGERSRDRAVASTAPGVGDLVDASLSRIELQQLASRVKQQLQSAGARGGATSSAASGSSALLAGSESLAPTLEQQLDFSSRGATHTIAVPASQLIELIESLALGDAASAATSLRMLPPVDAASTANAVAETPAIMAWLSDGPRVRQALHRLALSRSDAIILLPVIVK